MNRIKYKSWIEWNINHELINWNINHELNEI